MSSPSSPVRGAPIASAPREVPNGHWPEPTVPHHVLVFYGLAGSGKDTAAQPHVAAGATKICFADPLKAFVGQVFGWPRDLLYGPSELRNAPDPYGRLRPDGEPLTPRHALQTLGTEWGRGCYRDVWLELGLRRIAEARQTAPVVVTDARFANELTALRAIGAKLILVYRPEVSQMAHASEQELSSTVPDCVIENRGTVPALWAASRALR